MRVALRVDAAMARLVQRARGSVHGAGSAYEPRLAGKVVGDLGMGYGRGEYGPSASGPREGTGGILAELDCASPICRAVRFRSRERDLECERVRLRAGSTGSAVGAEGPATRATGSMAVTITPSCSRSPSANSTAAFESGKGGVEVEGLRDSTCALFVVTFRLIVLIEPLATSSMELVDVR